MTELSFLLELLLNHKLTKATKDAISTRIKEVELNLNSNKPAPQPTPQGRPARDPAAQAASTQALLEKDPSAPPGLPNNQAGQVLVAAPPSSALATNRIKGGEVTLRSTSGTTIKGPSKF